MSISSSRYSLLLLLAACGRLGFDARIGDGGGSSVSDGAPGGDATSAGLVAWWKLDEGSGQTAHDSAGTTDGAVDPTVTWTTGEFGDALLFPTTGAGVSLGASPALANLPAVTVSAWVNADEVTHSGEPQCLVDRGNNTGPIGGWTTQVARLADGDIAFDAWYGTSGNEVLRASSPGVLPVGSWHHVVMTWDGGALASGVHLYLDGVETTYALTQDAVGARPDDTPVLGAINCVATTGLGGVIDDVKIFGRALSAAEVTRI